MSTGDRPLDPERALGLLREWFDRTERDVVDPHVEDMCFFCGSVIFSELWGMDEGHKTDCYYLKVRQFLDNLKGENKDVASDT